ncbi:MAG: lipopolysaccharide kinase InaA family protein [Sedimentisphaerales bacterium]
MYIRKSFLSSDMGQALLAGEETLRKRYPLKTLWPSEFSRVCKFTIPFEGADRDIYIKWFFHKSGLSSLESLIFGSLAKCAYKAEVALAQNGFDVPVTIAIGESSSGLLCSKSFSVTLGIENTKRAVDIARQTREITTPEQLAGHRNLVRNFGRTIGKMHAKGIFHGDLRFGNVLLSPEGASWRFFFIDNVRTKKFILLPFWLRIKNLVQLNLSASDFLSRTDRMRFFTEYCARTGTGKKLGKVLIKTVLRKTRRRLNKEKIIRRALSQTLRTNSKYALVKTANYRGVFAKSFWPQTGPIDFIKNLDKTIESGQILKNNNSCVVSRLKWNGSDIAVARYETKGFIDSLRQTIGNSTAKSKWLNANRARLLKIPAPNPLAYIELRKSGLVRGSCFVTEYVEGQKLPDFPCDSNVPAVDK